MKHIYKHSNINSKGGVARVVKQLHLKAWEIARGLRSQKEEMPIQKREYCVQRSNRANSSPAQVASVNYAYPVRWQSIQYSFRNTQNKTVLFCRVYWLHTLGYSTFNRIANRCMAAIPEGATMPEPTTRGKKTRWVLPVWHFISFTCSLPLSLLHVTGYHLFYLMCCIQLFVEEGLSLAILNLKLFFLHSLMRMSSFVSALLSST